MKSSEKWIVCRVCLQQPQEAMQEIFDIDPTKDLTQMILECGGVPIKQFDHYPDKICVKCLKHLKWAHRFRVICQRSYKHLSRLIAPIEEDNKDSVMAGGTINASDEPSINDLTESLASVMDDETNASDGTTTLLYEEDEGKTTALEPEQEIIKDCYVVKEEYSEAEIEVEDEEIVDVYTPLEEDNFEQFDDFETFERDCSTASDVVEYLDDIGDNNLSSDEEFLPIKKNQTTIKKRSRGRPPKMENVKKAKSSTSLDSILMEIKTEKGKREPKSKDDKKKTFICDVCGNIYPTQGRLKMHIKSHNASKPHECEICGHAFAQNQQLARHMNTHTGNRPFKCNYCPSAFADLSTRNKHHRIHTNERPYVCDVCGKAFSYTNTLKFHKMIHTGEKPFVCDLCGKGFHQAYKLRNHQMTHEKKGARIEKIEVDSVESFQEVHEAAAQILEI